ncbi:hypothetical protein CTZ28_20105 [Streptomyces shenzhenensis]|uniref:SDR family oxidoreductase n=1 Tax=Streptomyces shenzhenensis TaxID=943815 RepID=A0A3M0I4R8_9ACTN|nr:hypothetical protein CTZ28_20105 [Streptomyces shenzhenensis]
MDGEVLSSHSRRPPGGRALRRRGGSPPGRAEPRAWGSVLSVCRARALVLDVLGPVSGAASRGAPCSTSVAASLCGAMESLTRAPALELAPLRVDVVCPGLVRTDLWREMPQDDRAGLFESSAAALPVGRAGTPEDVAEAYLYLLRRDPDRLRPAARRRPRPPPNRCCTRRASTARRQARARGAFGGRQRVRGARPCARRPPNGPQFL